LSEPEKKCLLYLFAIEIYGTSLWNWARKEKFYKWVIFQGSYRSGKTGESRGKWSWIMQTADSCDFLSPNVKCRQICGFH